MTQKVFGGWVRRTKDILGKQRNPIFVVTQHIPNIYYILSIFREKGKHFSSISKMINYQQDHFGLGFIKN
jgi:hypothetical protein